MMYDISIGHQDANIQTDDYERYQHIISNLETFVVCHKAPGKKRSLSSFPYFLKFFLLETELRTPEDVELCLKISFAALHLLYYATKKYYIDRRDMIGAEDKLAVSIILSHIFSFFTS